LAPGDLIIDEMTAMIEDNVICQVRPEIPAAMSDSVITVDFPEEMRLGIADPVRVGECRKGLFVRE
jgi:hypothetical protein